MPCKPTAWLPDSGSRQAIVRPAPDHSRARLIAIWHTSASLQLFRAKSRKTWFVFLILWGFSLEPWSLEAQ